jgi:hypothetical protein
MRGRADAAFMRPEEGGQLVYPRVITEPFVVIFPATTALPA